MRDERVDLLRFIGLAMILFAHAQPPAVLFQLRNFDVPLMVFVAGISFRLSHANTRSYLGYLWRRVKRLVFPVWLFLTFYFLVTYIFNPDSSDLNLETIVASYTLVDGIGFVWVIKVFLLVAIISPLISSLSSNTISHRRYFFVIIACMFFYEIARYLSLPYIHTGALKSVSLITHYIVPFSIVFALGVRVLDLNRRQLLTVSLCSFICFIFVALSIYGVSGKVAPTQLFKYPPSIYYLSYALFVSVLLWTYSACIWRYIEKAYFKKFVIFISKNSMWIYLWHIPLAKNVDMHFLLKFLVVFSLAATVTRFQVWFVYRVIEPIGSNAVKRNIKVLLTG